MCSCGMWHCVAEEISTANSQEVSEDGDIFFSKTLVSFDVQATVHRDRVL